MNKGAELLGVAPGTQGQKARRLEVSQPFVSALLSGKKVPGPDLRRKIDELYAVPYAAWDQMAGQAEDDPRPDVGPAEVQRLLEEGRPLAEVYAVAARAMAISLASGLSPDRQRAWTTMLRLLRDGDAAAKRVTELEKHPDFGPWVESLLDALTPIPDALGALEAHLKRNAEPPSSKSAA